MKKWILAAGLVAALSAAGCSSSEGAADAETTTAQAVTSTASAAADTGVTWKYLQSEHSKFLGMECSGSAGVDDSICIGLRNAGIASFVRDATDLPRSQARASALDAAEGMKDDYADYQAKRCDIKPEGAACIGKSLEMDLGHSTIVTIVNREAAAQ
ncbi:hypothetical protein [Prescottella agglutinans]|uniref:hypothetical protein n=1 Tax=Prescottella agglutinans TaxID=1644129 RepID=UPI003D989B4E